MNKPANIDRRSFLQGSFAAGVLIAAGSVCGCSASGDAQSSSGSASPGGASFDFDDSVKAATSFTAEANEAMYALLDFSDENELACAQRGLIVAPDCLEIVDDNGNVVWSQDAYGFLDGESPATANPSLWRNSQLNHLYGLFEVAKNIYQVRGYDLTNMTFVRGRSGWIVFDPMMSCECARAAYALICDNVEDLPVAGVVISHTHVDHYGGIEGIVSQEDIADRGIPIIAPEGFLEHAVSENIYAGNAMTRRAMYQYGVGLKPGECGRLGMGIGLTQSTGTIGFAIPTHYITETGETLVVDGVTMEFQLTPGTEAPAEMNTWLPELKALWMAENCTGTLHNLYTLRGAAVRDGNAWANYIMEAKSRYGADAEVVFQSHNWPHWGNAEVNEYLANTAAVYKFIATQTLMYLNQGYTGAEIARMIALPDALARVWYTRQYYGTVAHNARAVYQKYMGYYDANPVNLHRLTPQEEALKLVEYLGDVDAVLRRAKDDFDRGEYQWVAQITNALVFADPSNEAARLLCADALEQLGYQAESGTWRNAYLTGALELRMNHVIENAPAKGAGSVRTAMTTPMVLDYLGICLDSNGAQDLNFVANLDVVGDEPYVMTVRAGVLLYERSKLVEHADLTLRAAPIGLMAIVSGDKATIANAVSIEGDASLVDELVRHMVSFKPDFNIVLP